MATYETKYALRSDTYSGRVTYHDTDSEAKAHYDTLMADPVYMDFDTGDVNYYIIQVTHVTP